MRGTKREVNAFEQGRMAAQLPPEERENYKNLHKAKHEARRHANLQRLQAGYDVSNEKEGRLMAELTSMGNLSVRGAIVLLVIALLEACALALCGVGELVFMKWMIEQFGIGSDWAEWGVALAMMIVSTETVDRFLKWHRASYPQHTNKTLLGIFCFTLFCVCFMIVVGGNIRADLMPALSQIQDADSLSASIEAAQQFFSGNNQSFMLLMGSLTMAFMLIAGCTYHDIKHRIPQALSVWRIHSKIEKERRRQESYQNQVIDQNGEEFSFDADFEEGLLAEESRKSRQTDMGGFSGITEGSGFKSFGDKLIPLLPLIIILAAILVFLFLKSNAFADEHIVLLDLSKSQIATGYRGVDTEFQKNLEGMRDYVKTQTQPGDFLRIIAITGDSFSRPYVLLEALMPSRTGYFGEVINKKRLEVIHRIEELHLEPTEDSTDILGAVNLAELYFSQSKEPKRLIIFSDMRQCAQGDNFEKPPLIKTEYWLERLHQLGLVPSLPGVSVRCLGVHTADKDAAYWRSLRDFWAAFFKESKATLISFSADRRIEP